MPPLSLEKLRARIGRGDAVPAIVLEGADAYLLDMCRKQIVDAFVPEGARDWAVARISARETGWEDILQRAQMLPMLAPRQVIFVEDVQSVERLGDKARDKIVEDLEAYLASPAPFTVLVLEAARLDRRQKFGKLLDQKALVVDLTVSGESLTEFVSLMANEVGVRIDGDAAAFLADILNGEPARMHVELQKLAAYVGNSKRVALADVEAIVVAARRNTVWQFAEMIADRKRDVAFAFLDNLLREGEEPIAIVGAMAWLYRKLIEARGLPATTNGYQAARSLGMRSDAAENALRQAHRMARKDLLAGLAALAAADSALKSSNPNPRATMEFLVAQLTTRPAA